jgi:hypothetical protein
LDFTDFALPGFPIGFATITVFDFTTGIDFFVGFATGSDFFADLKPNFVALIACFPAFPFVGAFAFTPEGAEALTFPLFFAVLTGMLYRPFI